jgi:hypothetical protein
LAIPDDDDCLYQNNEHLGEIQVAVQSVERFDPVIPKEGGRFNDAIRIHERSKKALATCIRYAYSNSASLFVDLASRRFGETKAHAGTPPKNFVARGAKNVCTFVFKYRTMGTPLSPMTSMLSHSLQLFVDVLVANEIATLETRSLTPIMIEESSPMPPLKERKGCGHKFAEPAGKAKAKKVKSAHEPKVEDELEEMVGHLQYARPTKT